MLPFAFLIHALAVHRGRAVTVLGSLSARVQISFWLGSDFHEGKLPGWFADGRSITDILLAPLRSPEQTTRHEIITGTNRMYARIQNGVLQIRLQYNYWKMYMFVAIVFHKCSGGSKQGGAKFRSHICGTWCFFQPVCSFTKNTVSPVSCIE